MAGPVPNRIDSEEEYEEIHKRILAGADRIDHPLTTPEEREKLMILYDALVDVAQRYQRRLIIEKHPEKRKEYIRLGWLFDEPLSAEDSTKESTNQPEITPAVDPAAAPPNEPETSKKACISTWLDDDD